MEFLYDDEGECYILETDKLIVSMTKDLYADNRNVLYAKTLVDSFKEKYNKLIEYIINDKTFIECYGKMSIDGFLKNYEAAPQPWIWISGIEEGVIAFCDEDYVVQCNFRGQLDEFFELSCEA